MFSILILLALSKECSSQIFARGSLDHTISLWNQTSSFLINSQSNKNLKSLDFDPYNKLILAGCEEKSILLWNISSNTERFISTNVSVDTILSLNSTHFIVGSNNTLIIYQLSDYSNKTIIENFGKVSDMKLLKNEDLVLIGTDKSKIVVFSFNTLDIVFNRFNNSKIMSLDCLNRSFIVAQCEEDKICLLSLNHANNLILTKGFFLSQSCTLFSIKIVNINCIVFVIDYSPGNTQEFGRLDLKLEQISKTNNKIRVIEVVDQEKIIFDNDEKIFRFENLSDKELGRLQKFSNIIILKRIYPFQISYFLDSFGTTNNQENVEITSFELAVHSTFDKQIITSRESTELIQQITSPFTIYPISKNSITLEPDKDQFMNSTNMILAEFPRSTNKHSFENTYLLNSTKSSLMYENTSLLNYTLFTSKSVFTIKYTSQVFLETSTVQYNYFNLDNDQNLKVIVSLITRNVDMNDCLLNCSGHGKCKMVNPSLYSCECFDNYSGSTCQINTLPCSSNPCRNNGTCENNLIEKTYKCQCYSPLNHTSLFYGHNCENKVDICHNQTCSNKGVCYDINYQAKCKCFDGYSGEKCEFETYEIKVVKTVISFASIVAIAIIALFFLSIVSLDLLDLIFGRGELLRRNRKSLNPKKKIIIKKFVYRN